MLSIRWKINSQSWQPYYIQMTNTPNKKSFTMSKTNKQKEQQQQPKKTP